MKCKYCDYESTEDFKFCAKCGKPSLPDEQPTVYTATIYNPLADTVLSVLKDDLFMVLCILMTITAACGLFAGGIPVINILLSIFLWLAYSKAKKGVADAKNLRCISGTVYANYILSNVLAIIVIVCGVITAFLLTVLSADNILLREVFEEAASEIPFLYNLPQAFVAVAGWVLGLVLIFLGGLILVFNILGMRKIHRFAKSVYEAVSDVNRDFYKSPSVKGWLIFFAVTNIISAVSSVSSNFWSAASAGCAAASCFLTIMLIKKYII